MTQILPDCMMPDGADPCAGYQALAARLAEAEARIESMRNDDWGSLRRRVESAEALLREARERETRYVLPLYRDDNYMARIDAALTGKDAT
jgi:alkylation response protein AidB-like acyl-CoA dehydrogenase